MLGVFFKLLFRSSQNLVFIVIIEIFMEILVLLFLTIACK